MINRTIAPVNNLVRVGRLGRIQILRGDTRYRIIIIIKLSFRNLLHQCHRGAGRRSWSRSFIIRHCCLGPASLLHQQNSLAKYPDVTYWWSVRTTVSGELDHISDWATFNNVRLNMKESRELLLNKRSGFVPPSASQTWNACLQRGCFESRYATIWTLQRTLLESSRPALDPCMHSAY